LRILPGLAGLVSEQEKKMLFFDGTTLLSYEFGGTTTDIKPGEYCRITGVNDTQFGKIYHYKAKSFKSIAAALGSDEVVKARIRHQEFRGGGGFSTPDDAVLYTASGRRISTSRTIASEFCNGEPVEEYSTDGWTGAGYSFLVYAKQDKLK